MAIGRSGPSSQNCLAVVVVVVVVEVVVAIAGKNSLV